MNGIKDDVFFPEWLLHSIFYLWAPSTLSLVTLFLSFLSVPSCEGLLHSPLIHSSIDGLLDSCVSCVLKTLLLQTFSHACLWETLYIHLRLPRVELLGPRCAHVCSTVADVSMHISHIQCTPLIYIMAQEAGVLGTRVSITHHLEAGQPSKSHVKRINL